MFKKMILLIIIVNFILPHEGKLSICTNKLQIFAHFQALYTRWKRYESMSGKDSVRQSLQLKGKEQIWEPLFWLSWMFFFFFSVIECGLKCDRQSKCNSFRSCSQKCWVTFTTNVSSFISTYHKSIASWIL